MNSDPTGTRSYYYFVDATHRRYRIDTATAAGVRYQSEIVLAGADRPRRCLAYFSGVLPRPPV